MPGVKHNNGCPAACSGSVQRHDPGAVRSSTRSGSTVQPFGTCAAQRRSASAERTSASTVGPAPETTAGTPDRRSGRDELRGPRHRRRAVLLVQPVLGGREQQLGCGRQRGRQEGGPTGVGGGVREGDGRRAASPAPSWSSCASPGRRRPGARSGWASRRCSLHRAPPGERQPAAQAGRDVVGVPFELGREGEGTRRRRAARRPPARGPAQRRRRRRSRPTDEPSPRDCGMRLAHTTSSPRGCPPSRSNAARSDLTTRCRSSRGRSSAPSPATSTTSPLSATRTTTSSYNVSARPGAVEAGPEVGAGGGHADADRCRAERGHSSVIRTVSPSAAAASADAATVTGLGAPAMAQSGSLRPLPVTVHTTRSPGRDVPGGLPGLQQAGDGRGGGRLDEDRLLLRRAAGRPRGSAGR